MLIGMCECLKAEVLAKSEAIILILSRSTGRRLSYMRGLGADLNCAVQVSGLHVPRLHKFKHYRPLRRASI